MYYHFLWGQLSRIHNRKQCLFTEHLVELLCVEFVKKPTARGVRTNGHSMGETAFLCNGIGYDREIIVVKESLLAIVQREQVQNNSCE